LREDAALGRFLRFCYFADVLSLLQKA
jgi:hypothetical protein